MKFVLSSALLLFSFASATFPQSPKITSRLLLTTKKSVFRAGENTKVNLTFENKTGRTIRPNRDFSGRLTLQRSNVKSWDDCFWNNCYSAYLISMSDIEVPNRGLFEIELDLADVFWRDMTDCCIRVTKENINTKNFFNEIMSGDFNFKIELDYFIWKGKTNRFSNVFESNDLPITIETERKYQK